MSGKKRLTKEEKKAIKAAAKAAVKAAKKIKKAKKENKPVAQVEKIQNNNTTSIKITF